MSLRNESSPSRARRALSSPLTWAGVVVVVVILSIIVVAVVKGGSTSGDPSAARPMPTTSPLVTSIPPSSGGAGPYLGSGLDSLGRGYRIPKNSAGYALPQKDRPSSSTLTQPISAPSGLEWQRVYGAPVPFSSSDGPSDVHDDGTVRGFTHTPQGAALASWQLFMRLVIGSPQVRQAILAHSTVNGADTSVTSKLPDYSSYHDAASSAVIPAGVQLAADKYTPTTAFVAWALGPLPAPDDHPTDSGYAYMQQRIGVVWQDGDWKLNLGDWSADATPNWFDSLDAAAGWATWN